jgi:hypothetical protein
MTAVHTAEMAVPFLGIILSLANWRKYPRPALLSFLGFALVLGTNIALVGFFVLYVYVIADIQPGWDGEITFLASHGVRSLLTGGGYLLLIFAIYAGRKPKAPVPSIAFADASK